ncbi:LytR/AlgR family response regulator transcription factor [Sphingomonas montana]|uniref:LytR/AlgR family response regulator transcription factor n=1 Tax=Sphingomonas montana TaxID=1843236 RepID=UPI00096EBD80|nr:LytTR family DNA-binding domain-containing protein [Sphingomonas montana]
MAPLRILIVDDEALALDRLETLLARIADVVVVGRATDGIDALDRIAALTPDVMLLDIQMPGLDGLGVAAALDGGQRPDLVFVTAHDHHAPAAFDVDAVDYLLKPVDPDRLARAVARVRLRRHGRPPGPGTTTGVDASPTGHDLWVPDRTGLRRVAVADIDWIEAARDYVLLHAADRSHMLRVTMTDLERRLAGSALVRVHRSAFVRPDRVARIGRSGRTAILILTDGTQVQVGPSYLDRLEAILAG